jgi:hypothetical protein
LTASVLFGTDGAVKSIDGVCTCELAPGCDHPIALVLVSHAAAVPKRRSAPSWESALAAIVFYAMTLGSETRLSRLALTLVVAGAVGNLIDRVVAGAVVDFVDVYLGTWHFWAFNVADTCISCGAVLLIFDMLRTGSHVPSPA